MTATPTTPNVASVELLEQINSLLESLDLPQLGRLGDSNRLEGQITGMPEVSTRGLPFFYILTFPFIRPSGETGFHHMVAEANTGKHPSTVVVLMINGHLMLTRQFRVAQGENFNEVPRGFGGALLDCLEAFADVPSEFNDALRIVLREVPQQMIDGITESHFWHLGDVPHNTGLMMGDIAYYLVHLTVSQEAMGNRQTRKGLRAADGITLMTSTLEGARRSVKDAHSVVAICGFADQIRDYLTHAGLAIVEPRAE